MNGRRRIIDFLGKGAVVRHAALQRLAPPSTISSMMEDGTLEREGRFGYRLSEGPQNPMHTVAKLGLHPVRGQRRVPDGSGAPPRPDRRVSPPRRGRGPSAQHQPTRPGGRLVGHPVAEPEDDDARRGRDGSERQRRPGHRPRPHRGGPVPAWTPFQGHRRTGRRVGGGRAFVGPGGSRTPAVGSRAEEVRKAVAYAEQLGWGEEMAEAASVALEVRRWDAPPMGRAS